MIDTLPKDDPRLERILITSDEIAVRVDALAKEIRGAYADANDVCIIGILNGATVFMTDLARALCRAGMPGITMKFIDGHEIDVGNLDVIDVLVLPEMGENSCKKFCESQKIPLQRFIARGGRVVGPESALQFLPGKAKFKAAKTQAEFIRHTLSKDR